MKTKLTAYRFTFHRTTCSYCQYWEIHQRISRKENIYQEGSAGLLLPHIKDVIFFNAKGKKKKKKITHIFYLAWAILQSMETHSHSQDWHMCTVRHKKPCCSDLISSNLVSFSRKKKKKNCAPGRTEDGMIKPGRNSKITKSTTARLIFLGPKLSGYKHYLFLFLKKKNWRKKKHQ